MIWGKRKPPLGEPVRRAERELQILKEKKTDDVVGRWLQYVDWWLISSADDC